jgi:hypothetical protein
MRNCFLKSPDFESRFQQCCQNISGFLDVYTSLNYEKITTKFESAFGDKKLLKIQHLLPIHPALT